MHAPHLTPLADPASMFRMDLHCHSRASSAPVIPAFAKFEVPECYSPPEKIYDQARARGMDAVTITDHDSIAGGLELVERGYESFILGEEVTVYFPEDGCKLHVLVWRHSPELHEEIATLKLRDDVYEFAAWLVQHNLPHAFAHPLYVQNGKLTAWHLERCALLFKGWETLNGAHSAHQNTTVVQYLRTLTPARINELSRSHNLPPLWPRTWDKAISAGSDDHALMNVGRTWTGVPRESLPDPADSAAFLSRVMTGDAFVGGQAGHSSLLAHQLSTVAANYYGQRLHDRLSPRRRHIASKLGRFVGLRLDRPAKTRLAFSEIRRRLRRRSRGSLPLIEALRDTLDPVLSRYPELRRRLDPMTWQDGPPIADHERMARFFDDLSAALITAMSTGALRAVRDRNKREIADHLLSYGILSLAQAPYFFSLFHQNKERRLLELIAHQSAALGSGESPLDRPMRISLFTDTIGDVNGVCRFIRDIARRAHDTGRDLQVIASTNIAGDPLPNLYNFSPLLAHALPKYQNLEVVLPPVLPILRHLDEHRPDLIHVSTPGPVGFVGLLAARALRIPVVGVYHTDFPAYIDRFFEDDTLTRITEFAMRFLYEHFAAVYTRSHDYASSLALMGIPRERIVPLLPGVETARFRPDLRDETIWRRLQSEGHSGIGRTGVKVIYVGRVSIEKNMPLLAEIWKLVARQCARRGLSADLAIVGDGPYRAEMEKALRHCSAHFLGFRHGDELTALYASSDLFIFPSVTDTLGQVVMEALASGVPAIVTDQGGPKEVVRDGETGRIFPPTDPERWANEITSLIADEGERLRMGRQAVRAMADHDIAHAFDHFWSEHESAWHAHLAQHGITRDAADAPAATSASPA